MNNGLEVVVGLILEVPKNLGYWRVSDDEYDAR